MYQGSLKNAQFIFHGHSGKMIEVLMPVRIHSDEIEVGSWMSSGSLSYLFSCVSDHIRSDSKKKYRKRENLENHFHRSKSRFCQQAHCVSSTRRSQKMLVQLGLC
ncbi:hypothetical protein BJV78DRAFT_702292 [Lactifluus subvellereus]|nr:hypothetical protein BJV78DRAFT_702292 [Lactifluus subvellereus]